MSEIPTIRINLDEACPACGRKGAVNGGLCLNCALKRLRGQDPYRRRRRPSKTPRHTGTKGQGSLFTGGKA